ncbi:FAD-dependent oxidoreductase [Micromonospora cremea]|uniref:2-polyprenyl-6-methoxyphenol hydroxylase n=1 Tax=Micromonospora cremea TaxID=709881 RepID=A0A1N5TL53_9ACTN|nr:NAD(P)/FAD-dependent oxidoreductase [Micromonospora cremea]SIM49044.1 2-polyprenyl-6-methoxyphenol hydroxylase [Micromonospora cremea]
MTRTRTALVIGGGIAGPVAAVALQKAGIDPVVYEAHPARADGIGVFLTLGSNGVDALRVLGADRGALAAGFPSPAITLRSRTGKHLGESRTGQSLPDGTTSQTIKRADLYRVLHEEASSRGVRIEHGKRLVAAEETGGGVRAVFADGSEAVGDVLIGCDGVHSTVRRIIDPAAPAPTYAGLLTNGGYVRGVRVDTEPGSYEMIFGKRAFFGYAMAPNGEVWWFANVPRRDEPACGEMRAISGEEWRRRLLRLYAEDAGPAVPLIQATLEMARMSPIHAVPHLPAWHNGRMVIIGDAAHAPSPTSGQGASLSIEDAVVLAKCLRDLPDPQAAFAGYEAARRPRVERIIKWAARINNSKAAGPVARAFRDATLPMILKMTADSKALKQTYDYHIDWDSPTLAAA